VRAVRCISPGAEITTSYGKKSNSRFLLSYGFTVEPHARDNYDMLASLSDCRILVMLSKDDIYYQVKRNLFGEPFWLSPYDWSFLFRQAFLEFSVNAPVVSSADTSSAESLKQTIMDLNERFSNTLEPEVILTSKYPIIHVDEIIISRNDELSGSDEESDVEDVNEESDDNNEDACTSCSTASVLDSYLFYGRGSVLQIPYSCPSSREFLSLARFITAQGRELVNLPFLDEINLQESPIAASSIDWELRRVPRAAHEVSSS
jgi:hypothetical protein